MLEDESGSAYYVAVFESKSRNDYDTVDVRHILIQPEASELSSDDEGYEDDVAAKKAEALEKAEALLEEWKAGEATEDSFAELAKTNSSDGSASEGGLYTEVYKGQMVAEFEDWCFDPARQAGDTGVVETTYGAHVMYFVGYDTPYWQVQVRNNLRTDAVNQWYEEKTGELTVEQGKVMNEELKRNIRDKVKENVTVVVKDDEPSVDKVVETMDKMSPEELQAIKDKLARMERENAEDAEVKDAE